MSEQELSYLADEVEAMKPFDHGFFKIIAFMQSYFVIISMLLLSLYVAPLFSTKLFRVIVNALLILSFYFIRKRVSASKDRVGKIINILAYNNSKQQLGCLKGNIFLFCFLAIALPVTLIIYLAEAGILGEDQEGFLVYSFYWAWLFGIVYYSENIFLSQFVVKWKHDARRRLAFDVSNNNIKRLLFGLLLFLSFLVSNFFTWVLFSNIIDSNDNLESVHAVNTTLICVALSVLFTAELISFHVNLKVSLVLSALQKTINQKRMS
jgi:hypothetical protein